MRAMLLLFKLAFWIFSLFCSGGDDDLPPT